ncbi:MAG TPA: hypothetical protein DCG88_09055 [Sphingobacterium sp.]|nr:hypothetical protein [Sphingobacterium sp.]
MQNLICFLFVFFGENLFLFDFLLLFASVSFVLAYNCSFFHFIFPFMLIIIGFFCFITLYYCVILFFLIFILKNS